MKRNLKNKININHRYSLKTSINLVKNENRKKGIKAVIYILVLIIFLILFTFLCIIRPMRKIASAKITYDRMEDSLSKLKLENSDYDEVRERFNEISEWYLDENETLEIDKYNVLEMIETDIIPYAQIESISISGRNIELSVHADNNYILSDILKRLLDDERIFYAKINDLTEDREVYDVENNLNIPNTAGKNVRASISIVYRSFSDNEEQGTKGSESDV